MKKRVISLLGVLALLAALLPAALASSVPSGDPGGLTYDSGIGGDAWEVLRLTNRHRMSIGLEPLSTTDAMQMAANQRAEELTVQYNADHSRPDGSECFTVLKDYGISCNLAAENIAYGYASAAAVVEGWLNSAGHRRNIETASLVHLGVGSASRYWAQDFVGSSACSYSGLSLSGSQVTGRVGQDLEDILTDADVTVTANCAEHGASYLPLIADMCSGYRADAAGVQTVTVSLGGESADLTVTLEADCTEHVYDGGTVTTAATCTAEGVMTYACTVCGDTKTETIPKAGHTPDSRGLCAVCGQTVGASAPAQTACATSYSILVDGRAVAFDAYALKDENDNDTNYLKLRDVAHILNGSAAQFNVGWDGSITITTGAAYTTPNGSEMSTPFSGDQPYTENASAIRIDGAQTDLSAITLTDANGGAYTYFKLRDLGRYLGFAVDWDGAAGAIVIDTTRPYSE